MRDIEKRRTKVRRLILDFNSWGHGGRLFVKGRIVEIDIFTVHFILAEPQALAKPLEMDDLPFPQEPNDVVYIRIIGQS